MNENAVKNPGIQIPEELADLLTKYPFPGKCLKGNI